MARVTHLPSLPLGKYLPLKQLLPWSPLPLRLSLVTKKQLKCSGSMLNSILFGELIDLVSWSTLIFYGWIYFIFIERWRSDNAPTPITKWWPANQTINNNNPPKKTLNFTLEESVQVYTRQLVSCACTEVLNLNHPFIVSCWWESPTGEREEEVDAFLVGHLCKLSVLPPSVGCIQLSNYSGHFLGTLFLWPALHLLRPSMAPFTPQPNTRNNGNKARPQCRQGNINYFWFPLLPDSYMSVSGR